MPRRTDREEPTEPRNLWRETWLGALAVLVVHAWLLFMTAARCSADDTSKGTSVCHFFTRHDLWFVVLLVPPAATFVLGIYAPSHGRVRGAILIGAGLSVAIIVILQIIAAG